MPETEPAAPEPTLLQRIRPHWQVLVLGLLYVILFLQQLATLIGVTWENPKYSHGYLIPVVSGMYIWMNQERIFAVERRSSWWGLLLLVPGLYLWILAQLTEFNALAHLSMMLVLVGMILFAAGFRFLRQLVFPLGFLLFAFPIPKRLDEVYVVQPLQRLASAISEKVIDALGIPVFRQGNIIDVPGMQLLVEEACSGIHSLYSLVALGTAFVFLVERRTWEKIVLILSTVPIAIFANVFRVSLTGVLAYNKPELAKGFFHSFSGLMVFLLGLGVFILWAAVLRWMFPVPPDPGEPTGPDQGAPATPQAAAGG